MYSILRSTSGNPASRYCSARTWVQFPPCWEHIALEGDSKKQANALFIFQNFLPLPHQSPTNKIQRGDMISFKKKKKKLLELQEQAATLVKWLNSRVLTGVEWKSENVITCLSTADWCIFKSKSKQPHPRPPLSKHQGNQLRPVSHCGCLSMAAFLFGCRVREEKIALKCNVCQWLWLKKKRQEKKEKEKETWQPTAS